ncbi:MAG: hypothetical protein ACK44E_11925, partial [Anaerolineales bacterium]
MDKVKGSLPKMNWLFVSALAHRLGLFRWHRQRTDGEEKMCKGLLLGLTAFVDQMVVKLKGRFKVLSSNALDKQFATKPLIYGLVVGVLFIFLVATLRPLLALQHQQKAGKA